MLLMVMQGNLNGVKPTMNFLVLSISRKTFPFKLKLDLVLFNDFF